MAKNVIKKDIYQQLKCSVCGTLHFWPKDDDTIEEEKFMCPACTQDIENEEQIEWYTDEEDFDLFCDTVKYWQAKLNLLDHEIHCEHGETPDGWLASCGVSHEDMNAYITLGTVWPIIITEKEVAKTAFHEVMEVRYSKLEAMVRDRNYNPHETRREVHRLIKVMENVMFEQYWNDSGLAEEEGFELEIELEKDEND